MRLLTTKVSQEKIIIANHRNLKHYQRSVRLYRAGRPTRPTLPNLRQPWVYTRATNNESLFEVPCEVISRTDSFLQPRLFAAASGPGVHTRAQVLPPEAFSRWCAIGVLLVIVVLNACYLYVAHRASSNRLKVRTSIKDLK